MNSHPMIDEQSKKKLAEALKIAGVMPLRNGEVQISIGPSQMIGNIKIITNTG
jgi:hypothetical protein